MHLFRVQVFIRVLSPVDSTPGQGESAFLCSASISLLDNWMPAVTWDSPYSRIFLCPEALFHRSQGLEFSMGPEGVDVQWRMWCLTPLNSFWKSQPRLVIGLLIGYGAFRAPVEIHPRLAVICLTWVTRVGGFTPVPSGPMFIFSKPPP